MTAWIRHVVVAAALAAGCGASQKQVTELELRAQVLQVDLRTMPPQQRAALERGDVWNGASEAEVFLARGEPRLWWNTRAGSRSCKVLVHANLVDGRTVDMAVTTCDGVVVALAPIAPAIPCWRIADVGPRVLAQVQYFDALPFYRQWQIVAGILVRGQSATDVEIAFGRPYSSGFEEREDGKRADKLVFLDHSGNAYGLSVTLIADQVVAWAMPAEQVLTPEAQQRRLDALEQHLQTKIAELEDLTRRQHEETVQQFGTVMRNKDSMLDKLASGLASAVGIAAQQLTAPGEVETTHESEEEATDSGSVKVDQSKPGTTTIELDEHSTKSSKSTTVKRRKR